MSRRMASGRCSSYGLSAVLGLNHVVPELGQELRAPHPHERGIVGDDSFAIGVSGRAPGYSPHPSCHQGHHAAAFRFQAWATRSVNEVPRPSAESTSTVPPSPSMRVRRCRAPRRVLTAASARRPSSRRARTRGQAAQRSRRAHLLRGEHSTPHGRLAHRRRVDAATVIGHCHDEARVREARIDANRSNLGLSARNPLVGRLDAVIDGVADELQERRTQLIESCARNLEIASTDDKPHLLLGGAPQCLDVRKRTGPARWRDRSVSSAARGEGGRAAGDAEDGSLPHEWSR